MSAAKRDIYVSPYRTNQDSEETGVEGRFLSHAQRQRRLGQFSQAARRRNMEPEKKRRLEAAGWKETWEFLTPIS